MTDDLLVLNLHEPYNESVAQRFPYEIHIVNVVKMSIQKPSPRAKADMAGSAMPSMQQVLTILEGRLLMLGALARTWHPDPLNPQMKPPVKLWLSRPWITIAL